MLYYYMNAELQDSEVRDGKLLNATNQWFYFHKKELNASWNLVRWTMQGAHILTASLRDRKGGKWESLSSGNASWVLDVNK